MREFLAAYLTAEKRVLYVGGAGFDPRSAWALAGIAGVGAGTLNAILLRESRRSPDQALIDLGESNAAAMVALPDAASTHVVDIFDPRDGAVVGGRRAVAVLQDVLNEDPSDVFIDFSALSLGIAYPMARYLLESSESSANDPQIHLVALDQPEIDRAIQRESHDKAGYVLGFKSDVGLTSSGERAKLWIPQLVEGRRHVLDRIHDMLKPDDTCPVLPFPSVDPRRSDALMEHYAEEFEGSWGVTPQNLVYADERNPLDLYRTILRIDDVRDRVFRELDGAQTVLSPMGSKALGIGAFMAAVERDFPVAYVEAEAYHVPDGAFEAIPDHGEMVHVWLRRERQICC